LKNPLYFFISYSFSPCFCVGLLRCCTSHTSADADHDQATNGFGSKILKVFKLSGYLQWPIWRGLRPIRRFLVSVCAPQKPFFGGGVRWWGKNGQFLKIIIFSIFAYNSAKKCAILDHDTILETSGHILVSFEPKNGKKWPKISTPRRRSQKPKIWPTARWHVHLFYTRQKFGFQLQNPLRIFICQFLSAVCIGFQPLRGSKIEKIGKKAKKWKKMKKFCKLTIFSSILPPNCIFSMDDWWHWGSPSIFSFLNPKKLVFGSKRGNFENLKILKSGSLLRLWCPYYASPRPGRCLCAERNSRRWFWVLNGLCTTSGSWDMGRQSLLE